PRSSSSSASSFSPCGTGVARPATGTSVRGSAWRSVRSAGWRCGRRPPPLQGSTVLELCYPGLTPRATLLSSSGAFRKLSTENIRDLCSEHGCLLRGSHPDDRPLDREVGVNCDVAEVANVTPRNFRITITEV